MGTEGNLCQCDTRWEGNWVVDLDIMISSSERWRRNVTTSTS
jgi:hypothetical protein